MLYVDFKSEDVLKFAGGAGCDMPDKVCPKCGNKLQKLGFDIPFETFLGFKGNKEPDIDLNFSNEYQSKAHAFTEVIFGKEKGQTFKSGNNRYSCRKRQHLVLLRAILKNCLRRQARQWSRENVKLSVLQADALMYEELQVSIRGGIVVLPIGEEIHSFTPVQHPANDMKSDIVTTHFDYHSIDHNLLKLDILGHLILQ